MLRQIGNSLLRLSELPPVMIPCSENYTDSNGNPAGGVSFGPGFCISWQNGPLGRPGDPKYPRVNGAFVEVILRAAMSRIDFFQASRFACEENAKASLLIAEALDVLESRRNRRVSEGTYGTNEGK